jgi:hypothetical protein
MLETSGGGKMNKYALERPHLNTFDILCCEPDSWFMKPIGHTAMIIRDDAKDMLWVWQSTTMYAGYPGTSLTPLKPWLEQYPGKVYVRNLAMRGNMRFCASTWLNEYIRLNRGKPYPNLQKTSGLWYMAKTVLHLGKPNVPVAGALQCTGRIIDTLQYCGLIVPEANSSAFEPDEVRENAPLHDKTDKWFVKGVSIGKEIELN